MTYGSEAKKLLENLQNRNERMFMLTFLVLNFGETKQKLDNNFFQASSIAQKYNCILTKLDFQQEEGLMSSLPLGMNQVKSRELSQRLLRQYSFHSRLRSCFRMAKKRYIAG